MRPPVAMVAPAAAVRLALLSVCPQHATVSASSAIRRCWCLDVFLPGLRAVLGNACPDDENGVVKIEQRAHSSPRLAPVVIASHSNTPPRKVGERGVEYSGGLLGCGRMRVMLDRAAI